MRFFLTNKIRSISLAGSFLICFFCSTAQSLLFPTDYFFDVKRQATLAMDTTTFIHTSMQPFLYTDVPPDTFKKMKAGADPFFDKLLYENLIEVRHVDKSSGYNRKFNFNINPIMNFSYGRDFVDVAAATVQDNTRGIWVRGELGKKLIFESAFIENQSYSARYIYVYGQATGVVPGQGRWKQYKGTGYDYASAYGVLNYAAGKNFTVRVGHGKQKIGNGYRSLLLSDNAFNYPYLQFITHFFKGKLQYSQTYALLMNLTDGGAKTPPNTERIFQKKPASFQHLSLHAAKWLDLYFFQGMIWKASDSSNAVHLDPFYANPVIFTNLARFGVNKNSNHILIGGGFELRPTKTLQIYSQFMYDGVSTYTTSAGQTGTRNNFGVQGGIKYYDVFGLRNLFFQFETNVVNGKSYASTQHAYQDYSHYNQSLATPALLTNEFIAMLSYSYKRFFVQLKQNIFTNNYSGAAGNYFDGKIGYMINPNYKLNLAVGTAVRSFTPGTEVEQMQLFYVSLRTSLYNLYYDF